MVTRGVFDLQNENKEFATFVYNSLKNYIQCDWGNTCEEDWECNDDAVKNNERILAEYCDVKHPEWRIWIITEWDRSVTTILFPSEY